MVDDPIEKLRARLEKLEEDIAKEREAWRLQVERLTALVAHYNEGNEAARECEEQ